MKETTFKELFLFFHDNCNQKIKNEGQKKCLRAIIKLKKDVTYTSLIKELVISRNKEEDEKSLLEHPRRSSKGKIKLE